MYTPLEFYNVLLPFEMGTKKLSPEEMEKANKMKEYLKKEFQTDKIQQVELEDLKKRINGDHIIGRL